MATRSGGGVGGVVYGLVVFVFLAVLGIALAILFYSQKTTAEQELAELQETVDDIVTGPEKNNQTFVNAEQRSGTDTVFSVLLDDIEQLKEWAVGSQTATIEEIEASRLAEGVGLQPGDASVPTIRTLRTEVDAAEQKAATIQEQLDQKDDTISNLQSSLASAQQQHEGTVKELNKKLDEVRKQLEAEQAKLAQSNEKLTQTVNEVRAEKEKQLREKEAEIRARQNEIDQLQARIDQLIVELTGKKLRGPDATLQPDGEIIAVNLNENVVTINLGRADQLILGMTFEVFDRETGIQTEVNQEGRTVQVRGKATIEVIRFGEDGETSICRVVRSSYGEMIQQGDLISNVVYDEHRVYKFYVFGKFDLNNDGQAEPSEREEVERLIREWGGKVVEQDELPVDTDFLVLGRQVEYPEPLPDDPPPPADVIRDYREKIAEFRRYNELAAQAQELSMPVLNQNRFTILVGYYED